VHHRGGEPMLRGVGEPLLRWRAPGLARLICLKRIYNF
jgi:hypothetical protein